MYVVVMVMTRLSDFPGCSLGKDVRATSFYISVLTSHFCLFYHTELALSVSVCCVPINEWKIGHKILIPNKDKSCLPNLLFDKCDQDSFYFHSLAEHIFRHWSKAQWNFNLRLFQFLTLIWAILVPQLPCPL